MRKLMTSIFALLLASMLLPAQTPDWLHIGVEWGCSERFFNAFHYNYISDEGYRVDEEGAAISTSFNGSVYAVATTPVSERISVGLAGGYTGVGMGERMFPLMARMNYHRFDCYSDGLFHTIDAGIAFREPDNHVHKVAGVIRVGSGYHCILGAECSVDIRLMIRTVFDSPHLDNPETGGYIEERNIRRNNAAYCALELTLGVNF